MKNLLLVCVVAFAFSTTAMAADIAISTQAGWFSQDAADREMQEIVDNVTTVSVEQFTADQQDALADWVVAHTGDGVSDLLILCGQFPATIYPAGNAQPDGSLAELFLDDGNTIVNTGDWMFYVGTAGNNDAGGLYNMMDITMDMWDDNTPVVVTADGQAYTPSLVDFQTDRPFHLDQLTGGWYAELVLAQNAAGTRADAVIVANAATGGRLGIFYQTASQDDDPRGEVISEWINNWYLTVGNVPNAPALIPNPEDGAVDVDAATLEWTAGYGAVSHKVYLSTDATIDESDLAAETESTMHFEPLTPGTTYYWRVDEVDADGNVIEGDVWSFSTLPLEAHFPSPADGAINFIGTELSWTPGKDAIMHNVNFGTDPAALLPVSMMQMDTSYDPGALDPDTTYYWRVDEFTPAGTVTGPVWSFSTPPVIPITDPNLAGWWKFDEGESLTALDSSGHGGHGSLVGGPQWVDGLEGTALQFSGSGQYVNCSNEAGAGVTADFTLIAWVKMAPDNAGQYMGIGGKLLSSDGYTGFSLVRHSSNVFRLWVGDGTTGLIGISSNLTYTDTEWHHVTGVREGQTNILYVDGMRQAATAESDFVQSPDFFHIGRQYSHLDDRYFEGIIDDVRLYDYAISNDELRLMAGVEALPWSPDPADGASGLAASVVLAWNPGDYAVEQVIYLGTDADAVAAADANDTTGIYRGRQVETTYAAAGLVWGTTQYWRADQVAADGSIVAGTVWSFTVIESVVLEDFEAYDIVPVDPDPAGLVGHWEFDGDLTSVDGIGPDGTVVGTVAFEDDPVRGQVLSLPGGDDQYVAIGSVGISGNMPKTIACWAKADHTDIPDWTLIFGFTGNVDGGGDNGSHFNIGSLGGPGGVGAHVWGWEETIFSDEEALEWHHYAMTYDGTTIQYYGDGVLMDTDTGKSNVMDLSISADRVHVGSRITQASSFPGKVDDARIYNYTLSQAEVAALGGFVPTTLLSYVWTDSGGVTSSIEATAVHGGTRAMSIQYQNDADPFVGEVSAAPLDIDMTQGARGLSLWVLGDPANGADPLYVALEDSAGASASVANPDALAAQNGEWTNWVVALDELAGVDLTSIVKASIGVGDGQPGGAGTVSVDDISLVGPAALAPLYAEDFESYAAGSDLHGQGGWKGWDNDVAWGAPASDAFAATGLNSVEIIGSADLVHEFDLAGGMLEFSAMQYIPSGTTGTTYFILLNTYNDGGPYDWSTQTSFDLAAGTITFWAGETTTILYDQWVELKLVIDLDNNTVDEYYNGELISTHEWDDNVNGTLGAIDLYSEGASSIYYDDITVSRLY